MGWPHLFPHLEVRGWTLSLLKDLFLPFFFFFSFSFFGLAACRILVPQPGIEPGCPRQLKKKHQLLTTGPPEKSLELFFL